MSSKNKRSRETRNNSSEEREVQDIIPKNKKVLRSPDINKEENLPEKEEKLPENNQKMNDIKELKEMMKEMMAEIK